MTVPFRVGYCVSCGDQAYAKNFRGDLLGAMPGTKLFYIVLSDDNGKECRVGTLMCCAKCNPSSLSIDDLKDTLFENAEISGVSGKEPEWSMPHERVEIVKEFKEAYGA